MLLAMHWPRNNFLICPVVVTVLVDHGSSLRGVPGERNYCQRQVLIDVTMIMDTNNQNRN